MPCLLTLFGQNSTTLSPLSTRTSSRKPRLQPCPNQEAAPAGAGDADADADDVKSPCAAVEPLPPTLHRRWLLRRKPQRKPQQCPPKNRRRRSKGRPDQGLIETCLSLHCCHQMHLSPIQRYRPGRIAAANSAAGQHTRAGLNRRPGISTYQYIPVHTVLYLLVLFLVPLCTSLYLVVPPCTSLYRTVHTSTYQYVLPQKCHRSVQTRLYWYVQFCLFLYRLVSRRGCTGTFQYVPPCTALYQGYRIPDGSWCLHS